MRIAASIAQIDNHYSVTQSLTNVGIELLVCAQNMSLLILTWPDSLPNT